jgi:hypothetical protein
LRELGASGTAADFATASTILIEFAALGIAAIRPSACAFHGQGEEVFLSGLDGARAAIIDREGREVGGTCFAARLAGSWLLRPFSDRKPQPKPSSLPSTVELIRGRVEDSSSAPSIGFSAGRFKGIDAVKWHGEPRYLKSVDRERRKVKRGSVKMIMKRSGRRVQPRKIALTLAGQDAAPVYDSHFVLQKYFLPLLQIIISISYLFSMYSMNTMLLRMQNLSSDHRFIEVDYVWNTPRLQTFSDWSLTGCSLLLVQDWLAGYIFTYLAKLQVITYSVRSPTQYSELFGISCERNVAIMQNISRVKRTIFAISAQYLTDCTLHGQGVSEIGTKRTIKDAGANLFSSSFLIFRSSSLEKFRARIENSNIPSMSSQYHVGNRLWRAQK